MGSTELAMERLKEMEKKGVEATAITYTSIIHSLYMRGKKEDAEALWDEMVNKGCSPDVGAYNVKIMRIQAEEPQGVLGLMEEMRNAGLKPDTVTYNYLMTCYCLNGMMDEAEMVYKEMEGSGCKPNATSFWSLIFHLCKNEKYEAAHEVFLQSVKANKIPDFNTLKHLVEGLVKSSKLNLAEGIL